MADLFFSRIIGKTSVRFIGSAFGKLSAKKKDKKRVLLRYLKNNLVAFVIDFVKTII